MSTITIPGLFKKKAAGEKITVLTAYDYNSAKMVDKAGVDIILVGDSLGNVILGYPTTLPVTVDEMLHHTRAVCKGVSSALVVGDMPYLSYHVNEDEAVRNAGRFLKECGASSVKLEGGNAYILKVIERMINAQIPVMGHIGLTPQSFHVMGGYKVQGKEKENAERIVAEAKALENVGVFSIVLEGIPSLLAKEITDSVRVPTIGIGAGPHCDGQVLVFHDMLGLSDQKPPKFVKQYALLHKTIVEAVSKYCQDVKEGRFPDKEHTY